MNVKQILDAAANNAGTELETLLRQQIADKPDMAPLFQPILDALNVDFTAENVDKLVALLPQEAKDILLAHFNPRDHAGDSA